MFKILLLLLFSLSTIYAHSKDAIVDIGVIAGETMSLDTEKSFGLKLKKIILGSNLYIDDYLINNYLFTVGNRVFRHSSNNILPINYFILDSEVLNAFASFGGNIVIHKAIFLITDSESELAALLAHEIAHVNQRHVVRMLRDIQRKGPLTVSGIATSVLLMILYPPIGVLTAAATTGAMYQDRINYTRNHEEEADAIAFETLRKANFDPQGSVNLFSRFFSKSGSYSYIPEILLTHPIPENRINAARASMNFNRLKPYHESEDYLYAKYRLDIMYFDVDVKKLIVKYEHIKSNSKKKSKQFRAASYALALIYFELKKYVKAINEISGLIKEDLHYDKDFLLDIYSKILYKLGYKDKAIRVLDEYRSVYGDSYVSNHNLADFYSDQKQYREALNVLLSFKEYADQKYSAYNLNISTYEKIVDLSFRLEEYYLYHIFRSELYVYLGKYDNAILEIRDAQKYTKGDNLILQSSRAKIDEISKLRDKMDNLEL